MKMEGSKANFRCPQCGLGFLFENTRFLHIQNIHKNSELSLVLGNVESKVRENIGERISIVVGLEQRPSPAVVSPAVSTAVSTAVRRDLLPVKPRGRGGTDKCPQCSFRTRNLSLLLEHQALEHNPKPIPVFYCGYPTCWFPFSTPLARDEHEKVEHGSLAPPPFSCRLCRKKFSKWGPAQVKHYNNCLNKVWLRCPSNTMCSFRTRKPLHLQRHLQNVHLQSLASYSKDQYEVRAGAGQLAVKQEEIEVKIESQESREYYEDVEAGNVEDMKVSESSNSRVCPFDSRKFQSVESLHNHLHKAHLDTGSDSLDCPLGKDSLYCFCGRKTNCRHSLVMHVTRCQVNNSAVLRSQVLEVKLNPEAGSLANRRRAARKCRELGISDSPSKEERLKRAQMKMCQQLIGGPGEIKEEHEDDPDDSDEDRMKEEEYDPDDPDNMLTEEEEDTSQNEAEVESVRPELSPVKRKSYLVTLGGKPRVN